jgi:hypothetical protein
VSVAARGAARTVAPLIGVLLLVGGCGGSGSSPKKADPDEAGLGKAADRSTCVADAKKISSYPSGFPKNFVFPPRTIVYDAQDRGAEGVVVTGVTDLPFKQVLAALNGPTQAAGFKVTSGETEAHDAEANWTGNGFRGRWAIRESSSCSGETVVQVLSTTQ